MNRSDGVTVFVLGVVLVAYFVIGDYYPPALTYLVIVTFAYFLVDVVTRWFQPLYSRLTSFHAQFVGLLVGIVVSALFADVYTQAVAHGLSQYDPFWRNVIGSLFAWGFAVSIVRRRRLRASAE